MKRSHRAFELLRRTMLIADYREVVRMALETEMGAGTEYGKAGNLNGPDPEWSALLRTSIYASKVRCPHPKTALAMEQVRLYSAQLLDALCYLHNKAVVHRELRVGSRAV